jgi:hypothetical protein
LARKLPDLECCARSRTIRTVPSILRSTSRLARTRRAVLHGLDWLLLPLALLLLLGDMTLRMRLEA